MAYFDDGNWYDEYNINDNLASNLDDIIGDDEHLQDLIERALFDEVHGSELDLTELEEYLLEEYGIEFDEVFDWDDWRSWYEG